MTGQWQRIERVNAVLSCPDERSKQVAIEVVGVSACETYYVSALIDGHRSVPEFHAQIANVSDCLTFPDHRVLGGSSADSLIANAGYADDLSTVVDCGGGAVCVAGTQRKFLDLARVGCPDYRSKLENLSAYAGRIVDTVLRPTDYLAAIVSTSRKAVVAAGQRVQRFHQAVFPNEPKTGKSCSSRS